MSDIKHHARRCAHFKYVWQRVYDCCVCQTQAKRASTIKIYIFFIICDYQFAVYGTQYTRFRINNSEKKVFFGLVVAFEYHFFIWRFKYVFSGRKLYPRQYFRWLHFEILNIWIFLYSMFWIFKALIARGFNQLKLFDQSKWNNKIADLKSVIQIGYSPKMFIFTTILRRTKQKLLFPIVLFTQLILLNISRDISLNEICWMWRILDCEWWIIFDVELIKMRDNFCCFECISHYW